MDIISMSANTLRERITARPIGGTGGTDTVHTTTYGRSLATDVITATTVDIIVGGGSHTSTLPPPFCCRQNL